MDVYPAEPEPLVFAAASPQSVARSCAFQLSIFRVALPPPRLSPPKGTPRSVLFIRPPRPRLSTFLSSFLPSFLPSSSAVKHCSPLTDGDGLTNGETTDEAPFLISASATASIAGGPRSVGEEEEDGQGRGERWEGEGGLGTNGAANERGSVTKDRGGRRKIDESGMLA